MPLIYHPTLVTFFEWSSGLDVDGGGSETRPRVLRDFIFRYRTHFSSPVTMRGKNRPFLYQKSKETQVTTRPSRWVALSWYGTLRSNFVVKPCDSSRLLTVALFTWKVSPNSSTVRFGLFRMFWSRSSSENTDGCSYHGWYWQLLSPLLNFRNHRQRVLSSTASSPYNYQMLWQGAVALLSLSNLKSKQCLMCSWSVSISPTRYAVPACSSTITACACSNVPPITWLPIQALATPSVRSVLR